MSELGHEFKKHSYAEAYQAVNKIAIAIEKYVAHDRFELGDSGRGEEIKEYQKYLEYFTGLEFVDVVGQILHWNPDLVLEDESKYKALVDAFRIRISEGEIVDPEWIIEH